MITPVTTDPLTTAAVHTDTASSPVVALATETLASASTDSKEAQAIQKIEPIKAHNDLEQLFKTTESLFSKYDCPQPQIMKEILSAFDHLSLLYALIFTRACQAASPSKLAAINDLEFIDLFSNLFIKKSWILDGQDNQSKLEHQQNLTAIFLKFNSFIKKLNIQDKGTALVSDLAALNKSTSYYDKQRLTTKSVLTIAESFPTIVYLGKIIYDMLTVLQDVLFRQHQGAILSLEGCLGPMVNQKKNPTRNDLISLYEQLKSLKSYLVIRLAHLTKRHSYHQWTASTVIQEINNFINLFDLCTQSISRRLLKIEQGILRIQLSKLDSSTNKAEIEFLISNFLNQQFFNLIEDQQKCFAKNIRQFTDTLSRRGNFDTLPAPDPSKNYASILSKALNLLKKAMFCIDPEERTRTLLIFAAYKEKEMQGAPGEWKLILHLICDNALQCCQEIQQQLVLIKKPLEQAVHSTMWHLFDGAVIEPFLILIRNAFMQAYNRGVIFSQPLVIDTLAALSQAINSPSNTLAWPVAHYKKFAAHLKEYAQQIGEESIHAEIAQTANLITKEWVNHTEYLKLIIYSHQLAAVSRNKQTDPFFLGMHHSRNQIKKMESLFISSNELLCGVLESFPFVVLLDAPNGNGEWLDTIDADEEISQPKAPSDPATEEADQKETTDTIPITATTPTLAATFSLPSTLPNQPGGVIDLFKEMVGKFYPIPQPFASPIAAQKLPANTAVLRQQQFAMTCLKSVCELRKLSTAPAQQDLLTSQFFLLEHQALEQGLTHLSPNSSSHRLRTLLADIDLQGNFLSVRENPDATHFFRYPFVHNIAITPLALRHLMESTEKTTATQLNEREWLQDMIKMLTAAMTRHKAANKQEQDFADTMQGLIDHLATTEEEAKASIEKVMSLPTVQSKALQTKATELKEVIEALTKQLGMQSTSGRFSQNKIDTLKACVHHLKCLHVSIDLFKDFPLRKFLFLHAWTQQIAAQYFAENMGVFLSLANHDPYYSHNLMEYCSLYALDDGLSDPQKKTLASINLQKASEYLYKRSPHPTDKVATGKMKWLSSLYEQSTIEEGLSRGTTKPINTATLQQQVYDNCVELVNLVIPLTKKNIT